MRNVLLITYFFPPDGGGGTQRPARFCKYLPAFGWRPIVVAAPDFQRRNLWNPEDASLLDEVSAETLVIRPAPDLATDEQFGFRGIQGRCGYLGSMYLAARQAVEQHQPEIILITMSPFDFYQIGRRLAHETGLPVIYDLRDPWALDGWRVHSHRRMWRRDHAAMCETLSVADGIIANTPEAARALQAAVPACGGERMTVIPNGYDADDFTDPLPGASLDSDRDEAPLRLVHVGTLHTSLLYQYRGPMGWLRRWRHHRPEPIRPEGRTLYYLLKAIRRLSRRGHPLGRTRVELLGPADAATVRCIADAGLVGQVEVRGYTAYGESIRRMRTAPALFLPLHGLPPGRRSLIVPGKTYEYLASGRPILAALPSGDARDLIERSGRGFIADPCDADRLADAMIRLHETGNSGALSTTGNESWLQRYERRQLTADLAAYLNRSVPERLTRPPLKREVACGA